MNNFAISTDGLAEGLKRSASTLVAAGNSLEESIAMLAAGNKVVQDPEGLGNALKVLSMRIRGTKSELEAAGEETDGLVTNTSKLQSKIKALTNIDGKGGVDILTDTGAYRSTYQILLDIAQVWEDIDDMDQAALLELLAGKTRGSQLAAILQNPEDLKDAYETALDSNGSAQHELDTYLDSIQGRIELFTNAVQTMWMNLIDSDLVKGVVDIGTVLIKVLDQIGVVGATTFGALASFIVQNKINLIDLVSEFKDWGKIFATGLNAKTLNASVDLSKGGMSEYIKRMFNSQELSKEASSFLQKMYDDKEFIGKPGDKNAIKEYLDKALKGEEVSQRVTEATYAEIVAKEGLIATNLTLTQTLQALWSATWTFLTTNPVGQIMLITGAVAAAVAVFDLLTVSMEEQKEKLQEAKKAYETVESELKTLQDELKTTKDRIEELNAIDKLSFTEEEELRLLKQQNAELERKIYLKELEAKIERDKQNQEFVDTIKKDQTTLSDVNGQMGYTKETAFYSELERYKELDRMYQQAMQDAQTAKEAGDEAEYKKQNRLVEQYRGWRDQAAENAKAYKDEWVSIAEGISYVEKPMSDLDKETNKLLDSVRNAEDLYAITIDPTAQASTHAFNRVAGKNEFKDELESLEKQGVKTGEQLRAMLSFDENGVLQATNGEFSDFIQNLIRCGFIADTSTESLQRVADAIYKTGSYASGVELPTEFLSYNAIAEKVANYDAVMVQSQSILIEGQKVTEEYYNSLVSLGVTEEELSECIDKQNGYLVTNADELKGLLKLTNKSISSDAKLAKTQARLKYYDLYKDLKKLTNGTDNHSDATRSQINSLYDQMNAIQKVIAKYSTLEVALLGATNAYTAYEDAQTIDEANNYNTKIESMFQTIADGFQSGKLGTEAVQSAMAAVIPPEFFENVNDADEAMARIYKYFTEDLAGYVTLEFSDEGVVQSAEITKDNITKFFEDGKKAGVFEGTIDQFDLADSITNIDDFVAKFGEGGKKITKEMAFAFLAEFEKYDISWLGGDYESLFDQLMGDNLEYSIHKNTTALAELEYQFANGKITAEEYRTKLNELTAQQESLEEKSAEEVKLWTTRQEKLAEYQQQLDEYEQMLKDGVDSEGNPINKEQIQADIESTIKLMDDLVGEIKKAGEPTEIELTFAQTNVQKNIKEFKEQYAKNAVVMDVVTRIEKDGIESFGFEKGPDGKYTLTSIAQVFPELKDDQNTLVLIQEFLSYADTDHVINMLLGGNTPTVESTLSDIHQTLTDIAKILSVAYGIDLDTTTAETKVDGLLGRLQGLKSWWDSLWNSTPGTTTPQGGDNEANGTAHVRGTAYKGGSWGAPRSETALVGELGPELVKIL